MVIHGGENSVELEVLDVAPEHLPTPGDLRVRVKVVSDGFTGESKSVWIERQAVLGFSERLRRIEARWHGSAELVGMNPGEFRIQVRISELAAGLVVLEGELRKLVLNDRDTYDHRLQFGFEIDPTTLLTIADEIKQAASG